MTDPSSNNSGSGSNAWSTSISSIDVVRAGLSANKGSFATGSASADGGMSTSSPGTAGATGAADGSPSSITDRLSQNAATLRYLQKCHTEVLSSLRTAQSETTTLKSNLAQLNARAQTEHANLEQARSKLEDALYVNAHLREENEMIKTDDERWAFQVKDREEQLESLTELLVKLEKQQAEIDERKRLEEAEMVRRLEEERAEVVRLNMLAERERLTSGGNGGNTSGAGADAVEEGMPILPRGSGEMSSMLALAPEWTPMASTGGGGGTSLSEAIAIEPNIHTSGSNSAATSVILNTSSVSAGGVAVGGNDAASTVSALTTDM